MSNQQGVQVALLCVTQHWSRANFTIHQESTTHFYQHHGAREQSLHQRAERQFPLRYRSGQSGTEGSSRVESGCVEKEEGQPHTHTNQAERARGRRGRRKELMTPCPGVSMKALVLVHLGFGDRGPVAIRPRRLPSWDTTRTLPTPLVDSKRPRTPMSVPRAATNGAASAARVGPVRACAQRRVVGASQAGSDVASSA